MHERAQRFDPRQTMQRTDFEVFHYREPKPEGVEVHHHDFYEVYFLLGGEVDYWVEGRVFPLRQGDLLLIGPSELHRPIVKQGSTYERIVLWIDRNFLEDLSQEVDLTRCFDRALSTHTNLVRPSAAERGAVMSRLGDLVRE
ncbi:MAG: AraC family ligand binding domain-containing protein, partial [Clostridia bacterium]|nr:AraC family ligand binding domain-containing protein [Clostridia bacterium]